MTVRRSERQRKPSILKDYIIYSPEDECHMSIDEDPISFTQAMESDNSENWVNALLG